MKMKTVVGMIDAWMSHIVSTMVPHSDICLHL